MTSSNMDSSIPPPITRPESQRDARVVRIGLPSDSDHRASNSSDWYYDMTKKGEAIVFNHYEYISDGRIKVPTRTGTSFDTKRLKEVLEKINFNVSIHDDFTLKEINMQIDELTHLNSSMISCLLIIVLTHGENGLLRAADREYKIDWLWSRLTNTACPDLIGVPKLYFIQACRGDKVDAGVSVRLVTDGGRVEPVDYKLPSMSDILMMYSTYQDYSSWRDWDGSWFIQSLCEVIENEADNWDLLQLLTFVNRKVAIEYESYTNDPDTNKMKQIPQIVSMLTKLLKFKLVA